MNKKYLKKKIIKSFTFSISMLISGWVFMGATLTCMIFDLLDLGITFNVSALILFIIAMSNNEFTKKLIKRLE